MQYAEDFLATKNVLPETKEAYLRLLSDLSRDFSCCDLSSLSREELQDYFSKLCASRRATTFSRSFSVARAYYAYLAKRGIIKVSPMETLRAADFEKRPLCYLEQADFDRLIGPPATGIRARRDRAMMMLLCKTGLRVSELVALDRDSYDPSRRILICGHQKRKRVIALSSELARELDEYLAVSMLDSRRMEEAALFVNGNCRRLTRQGFWKTLKERAVRCGIDCYITPHLLRHSLAHHRLQEGEDAESVRYLLGNRDQASLREYMRKKD